MAEWLYRATAKKADWGATDDALRTYSFMWRPAYARKNKATGLHQLIANVGRVRSGDIIHLAFSWKRGKNSYLEAAGSFEVLAAQHPNYGEVVVDEGRPLSLFAVRGGSDLENRLDRTDYGRDPKLRAFVGWHVREMEALDIAFRKDMFPGNNAIHEYCPQGRESAASRTAPEVPQTASSATSPAAGPTRIVSLPVSGNALGVDWSGSAEAGKKVWAAQIAFGRTAARLDRLWRPFVGFDAAGVAGHFAAWLAAESFDVAGLDFCFGLAAGHSVPGMPRGGPVALGGWLSRFADPAAFKAAFGRERKRETDRLRRSPFAPTNLRMFRQTYWGVRALAGVGLPILPWSGPNPRAVIEVLPAHVAATLCAACRYKGRTPQAREERKRLLAALAGGCRLAVTEQDEEAILGDAEGDALDAVLAAVAAGAARHGGYAGVPQHAAGSGEGWIYSIP
jgi:hypothetical protein